MTETELALDEVAQALNRLALAVAALVLILIVLSWSLDEMALRVSLFGFMLRRVTPRQPVDQPAVPAETAVPVSSVVPDAPRAAQKAAKARSEDHAV